MIHIIIAISVTEVFIFLDKVTRIVGTIGHIEEADEVMLQETDRQASNTTEWDIEELGKEETNESNRP